MREQLYKYDGYSKTKAKSLPEQWLVEHKLSLNRCVSKCPSVLVISAVVVLVLGVELLTSIKGFP